MKNKFIKLFTVVFALTLCFGLASCTDVLHVCTFDKQIKTEKYRINSATCTQSATYHYSCECGNIGEETFTDGEPLGHAFNVYSPNTDATCEENGTKIAVCNRNCGEVDIVTIGQYIQPSKAHLPVAKYYTLEEFEELRKLAEKVGITNYQIDPLVRSSYKAALSWQEALKK